MLLVLCVKNPESAAGNIGSRRVFWCNVETPGYWVGLRKESTAGINGRADGMKIRACWMWGRVQQQDVILGGRLFIQSASYPAVKGIGEKRGRGSANSKFVDVYRLTAVLYVAVFEREIQCNHPTRYNSLDHCWKRQRAGSIVQGQVQMCVVTNSYIRICKCVV